MVSLYRDLNNIATRKRKHFYMSKINKIQNPLKQQRRKLLMVGLIHDLYKSSVSVDSRAVQILCFEFLKIVQQRSCMNVIFNTVHRCQIRC